MALTHMRHFIESIRAAVAQRNWYAALGLALTIPDICGKLESPTSSVQDRYVAWFSRYLAPSYTHIVGASHEVVTFLTARDCFALRCAYLHQGEFEIDDQRAQEILSRFEITAPHPPRMSHMNRVNNHGVFHLQLQVDFFCHEICVACEHWLAAVASDSAIQTRINSLPMIR